MKSYAIVSMMLLEKIVLYSYIEYLMIWCIEIKTILNY